MLNVRVFDFKNVVFLMHLSSPLQRNCYSHPLSHLCSHIQTIPDNFIYLCSNESILHHLAIGSDLRAWFFKTDIPLYMHQFTRDGFGGGSHWIKEQLYQ